MIYFVRSKKTGHIKIGYTTNMDSRYLTLRGEYGAIEILGVMDGSLSDEKNLHRKFRNLWIKPNVDVSRSREWFLQSEALLSYISSTTKPYKPETPSYLKNVFKIPVSESVRRELKSIAAKRGETIADLVRKSVQAYLEQEGIELDMFEGLDTWGGTGRKGKDEED